MRDSIVRRTSGKFARALLEVSQNQKILAEVLESFEIFLPLYRGNLELKIFLGNPLVPLEAKLRLVEEAFSKLLPPLAVNFLKILLQYKKERVIGEVTETFISLAHRALARIPVTATTARTMPSDFLKVIQDRLEEHLGQKIVLRHQVEPGLLGGILLAWDGKQVDATVRGRLKKLQSYLLGSAPS